MRECMTQRLLRVARFSAILALIIGIAWLVTEAAVIAGADGVRMALRALPVVALRTQFGQWLLLRLGLILVLLLVLTPRDATIVIATLLAAAGLAVQPVLGHAGAIGGSAGTTLIISEIIHLLAAGAWLGGLLPLFITIGGPTSRRCGDRVPQFHADRSLRRVAVGWHCGRPGRGIHGRLARVVRHRLTAKLRWRNSRCSSCC